MTLIQQGPKQTFVRRPGIKYKKYFKKEYRGHPFRVSGFFLSTYHQGSVQQTNRQLRFIN